MMIESWRLERVDMAPPRGELEQGVLYYGERLGFVQHLCACGCGLEVHVPTTGRWGYVVAHGRPPGADHGRIVR